MNNDSKLVRVRHLESVASAAKNFSLNLGGGTAADIFTGATSISGGSSGLVPAPASGDDTKFLRGDGTWQSISGGTVLDTVPATVDGGLWFEVVDNAPVIKIFYGDATYKLTPEIVYVDPQLSLSPSTVGVLYQGSSATVTANHLGNGAVSVTNLPTGVTASVNDDIITLSAASSASAGNKTCTVNLAASGSYLSATATLSFNVFMNVIGPI